MKYRKPKNITCTDYRCIYYGNYNYKTLVTGSTRKPTKTEGPVRTPPGNITTPRNIASASSWLVLPCGVIKHRNWTFPGKMICNWWICHSWVREDLYTHMQVFHVANPQWYFSYLYLLGRSWEAWNDFQVSWVTWRLPGFPGWFIDFIASGWPHCALLSDRNATRTS